MLANMWTPDLNWWELVVRGAVVYFFVLILLRVTGKRQVGQLAPFDLVLLLILSNAVQNAMNGGDNSITAGIIISVTLVGLNFGVGWATYRSRRLEELVEGRAVLLVHNGHLNHGGMNAAKLTVHELDTAIRAAGCAGVHEVRVAVLENSGEITVIPRNGASRRETAKT
jgi:uncharacterized membrane protein YcaP (DUF421 family)